MTDYRDSSDAVMKTSGASTKRYWGTGGADTLTGSGPDDTFYIYASSENVVETAGALATIVAQTWSPYTLPANVTNLTVSGAPGTVVGNGLNNLIIAQGSADMTISGGGGNDVMVANSGVDTFAFGATDGRDVIYNFDTSKDILRIGSDGFSSFAAVKAAMTQVGSDVVISLGANSSVTLRNTTASQLQAGNFELALDTSQRAMTFDDEFNSFTSSPDGSKGWMTSFHDNTRTLSGNNEAEYYSDSSVGVNPFSDSNGVLTITAAPAAPGSTPAGSGLTYTSGAITTWKSFSQLYGVFEMRAELPAGQGFWPAFWLLPANGAWPPELDVVEQLGSSPSTLYETSHTNDGGANSQTHFTTQLPGASTGFHDYAVDWEADKITWYVDDVAVASTATPSDMHTPMYMLLNLAVGANGSWPGAANGTSSAQLKVDWVRVYGAAGSAAAPTVAITAQTLTSDTGRSASDGITSNGAVRLTGTVTGSSGTAVQVFDGTALLGAATLDGQGGWSYATTLTSGSHALHAVASDASGKTASSTTQAAITVETTPPTVAITSEKARKTGEVTIKGTVSGATGTVVTLFAGQTSLGAAVLDGKGGWSYSGVLPGGTAAITAVATDPAGNSASVDPPLVVPAKTTADLLVLRLSENKAAGDVRFTVAVDGKQVGGTQTIEADHAAGGGDLLALAGAFGSGTHDVAVTVLNGSAGRSLFVGAITLDGKTTTESAVQSATGTAHYAVAAGAAGGTVSVGNGQTLILDKTAAAGLDVGIAGAGSSVRFMANPTASTTVSGFAAGDTLDLRAVAFSGQGMALSFANGVLGIGDGSAKLAMVGSYAASDFHLAADGNGGTVVTLQSHAG